MGRGADILTRALNDAATRKAEKVGERQQVGDITRLDPLTVKVFGLDYVLSDDDIVLSQWVRAYKENTGLKKTDNLVLHRVHGQWYAVDVISETLRPLKLKKSQRKGEVDTSSDKEKKQVEDEDAEESVAEGTVDSVFGRTGDVVATPGDYTVAQVTNAASKAELGAAVSVETSNRVTDVNEEQTAREAADTAINAAWAAGDTTRVLKTTLEASGVGCVQHGTNAATARPTGYKIVVWIGMVEPTNATATDIVIYENSSATFVPAARVYKASAQSLPGEKLTELVFDTERFDNAGIHSTSSNTGRLIAPKTGLYLVDVHAIWLPGAGGIGMSVIVKNGLTNYSSVRQAIEPNGEIQLAHSTVVFLNAGEYVTFSLYNSNASAKNVSSVSGTGPEAGLVWLGTGLKSEPVDWGIVTTLPASPTVGDRCEFMWELTNGYVWELLYTGKGTLPWAVMGGPPMVGSGAGGSTSSETPQTTGAAKVTTPAIKMEADVSVAGQANLAAAMAGATQGTLFAYVNGSNIGTVNTVDSAAFEGGWLNVTLYRASIEASKVVEARYASNNGRTYTFGALQAVVMPTRVG